MAKKKHTTKDPWTLIDTDLAKAEADACWEVGDLEKGRVLVWTDGKSINIQRWFWQSMHGPIPKSVWLVRDCKSPFCVNPTHFSTTTQAAENRIGFAAAALNLDPEDIERAKSLYRRKQTLKEIALRMGWSYLQARAAIAS